MKSSNQAKCRTQLLLMALATRQPAGDFYGVGEVLLRYYHGAKRNEPERNIPADSPSIKKLADTISANDAVLIIHLEPEVDATRSLDNLLTYNKEIKLI